MSRHAGLSNLVANLTSTNVFSRLYAHLILGAITGILSEY